MEQNKSTTKEVRYTNIEDVRQLCNAETGSWKESLGALRYMLRCADAYEERIAELQGMLSRVQPHPFPKARVGPSLKEVVRFALAVSCGVFIGLIL